MAKKRLNKKLALIGSAVFIFLILAVIGGILYLSQDPAKFIADGDAAFAAAEYETAERCYHKARSLAKTDQLKVQMLHKLVDLYLTTGKLKNVLGCWNNIVQIDPSDTRARFGRLEYVYMTADSGVDSAWQEVASQAQDFLDLASDAGLTGEPVEDMAILTSAQRTKTPPPGAGELGVWLHLLHGRALLATASAGGVTDRDKAIEEAKADLEKVVELEPGNVNAYLYLAQAVSLEGQIMASRGQIEGEEKATERADQILQAGVEAAGGDQAARINLLRMKQDNSTTDTIGQLEEQFLELAGQFESSAAVHSALAAYYSDYRFGPKKLVEAAEAIEKAIRFAPDNISYAKMAADIYYRVYSVLGREDSLRKAVEVAEGALELPGAREDEGPLAWANRTNRIWLYFFLANTCIEQVLDPAVPGSDTAQWLAKSEQAVHQIEQLLRSADDPLAVKWHGLLALARGDTNEAVRKLYSAYEQLAAADRRDPQLSYALAKIFMDSPQLGAVRDFLVSALRGGVVQVKPEAILDYSEVLMKLGGYDSAHGAVSSFENLFWSNDRSVKLRIRSLIGERKLDEAEQQLAILDRPDDPNTILLQLEIAGARAVQAGRTIAQKNRQSVLEAALEGKPAPQADAEDETIARELDGYSLVHAQLAEKLLSAAPGMVGENTIAQACNYYIGKGDTVRSAQLVEQYLAFSPDSTTGMFLKRLLAEDDPGNVSEERRLQIEQEVLSGVSDPARRALNMGLFLNRQAKPSEATGQFLKVIEVCGDRDPGPECEIAVRYLIDIASRTEQWDLAEKAVTYASASDLDGCGGQLFQAQLAVARGDYKQAISALDQCIDLRPVLAEAYMLRGLANDRLGNDLASLQDIRKAASFSPLDGNIAKILASSLYRQKVKLGDNVTSDQEMETRMALDAALNLNPNDMELLNFYTEYIGQSEPMRALAIRQSLNSGSPSLLNSLMLGNLATRLAIEESSPAKKQALFDMARSAYEQAMGLDPNDTAVLDGFASYYVASDQADRAEELLKNSGSNRLLWMHYLRTGRYQDAVAVLGRLNAERPSDPNVLKALVLVSEKTADGEAAEKYSQELLGVEDTLDNRLFQVQTYLAMGLLNEAEKQLPAIKDRYPSEPRTLLLEAWLAMRRGQLDDALELVNKNLQAGQDNWMGWRLRGQIHYMLANYDQAIIDLVNSITQSDEPSTRVLLARAYMAAGRNEDAVTELRVAMNRPAAPPEAAGLLEQTYRRLGRTGELQRFYSEMIQKGNDDVYWKSQAARLALSSGAFQPAASMFKEVLDQVSGSGPEQEIPILEGYMNALLASAGSSEAGNLDPAAAGRVVQEASAYIDGNAGAVAYLAMARAKLLLGDKAEAVRLSRKAIDKVAQDEAVLSNILRNVYSMLGAEEVTAYCVERLKAAPDSFAANWTMFNVCRIGGQYNKALDYIDKCIETTGYGPKGLEYIVQKAGVLQAAYEKTSDKNYLERAVNTYESYLEKTPNNTGVMNNLAYVMARADMRMEDALEYIEKAVAEQPNNGSFLDTYAFVLYKMGRFEEAAQRMQSAIQQYETARHAVPSEVYEHLGDINDRLGLKDRAVAAYRQALEAAGLSEQARQRIERTIESLSSP